MNARDLALKTLVQISNEQAFSNLEINKIIKEKQVSKKDQSLFVALVYGTLQHLLTLDFVLKKYIKKGFDQNSNEIKWILRLAVFQILFMNNIPDYAIVNEAVEQTKTINFRKKGFVNGVLRNIIRNKEKLIKEIKRSNKSEVKYSLPNWIYKKYEQTYGKKAEAVLNHLNDVPELFVRVKPENFDKVYNELNQLGAEPKKDSSLKNHGLIIKKPSVFKGGISNSSLFQKGLITIQDKGAIEIGLALEPEENDLILDICAAPGGKTTLLAEELNNTGRIDAFDLHPHRVKLIESTAKRLNLDNIYSSVKDATVFDPDLKEKYNKILVDAPCSGFGIIRRKPEIRYSVNQEEINELVKIQNQILNNAIKYLKPGGRLVYSTCTVNPEENTELVNNIINTNKEGIKLLNEVQTSFLDNSDGFYYAILEKK